MTPPVYHHLLDGAIPYANGSFDTASVTVPPNSLFVLSLGANTDPSAFAVDPVAAGTGLTITPVAMAAHNIGGGGYAGIAKVWKSFVGVGGFTGPINFSAAYDGFIPGAYSLGYYSLAEAADVVQFKTDVFAGDLTTKTVAFDTTPDAESALYAAWASSLQGGVGSSLDNKAGWAEPVDRLAGGSLSVVLEVQTFAGSTANSQATTPADPTVSWWLQAVIMEIAHAVGGGGGGSSAGSHGTDRALGRGIQRGAR